jgi:hypothetical protein
MSKEEVVAIWRGGTSLIGKDIPTSPIRRRTNKRQAKPAGRSKIHQPTVEERDPFMELPPTLQHLAMRKEGQPTLPPMPGSYRSGNIPINDRFQHRARANEVHSERAAARQARREARARERAGITTIERSGRSELQIGFGSDSDDGMISHKPSGAISSPIRSGKRTRKGNKVGMVVGGSGRQATIFTWNRHQVSDEMLEWVVEKKIGLRTPLEPAKPGQRLSKEEQKKYTRGELVLTVLDYDSRYEFFEILKHRWEHIQRYGRKKSKKESVFGGGAAARDFVRKRLPKL